MSTLPTVPICQEDMPCWDCTTMGNKICGIVINYGNDLVLYHLPVTGSAITPTTLLAGAVTALGIIFVWLVRGGTR